MAKDGKILRKKNTQKNGSWKNLRKELENYRKNKKLFEVMEKIGKLS